MEALARSLLHIPALPMPSRRRIAEQWQESEGQEYGRQEQSVAVEQCDKGDVVIVEVDPLDGGELGVLQKSAQSNFHDVRFRRCGQLECCPIVESVSGLRRQQLAVSHHWYVTNDLFCSAKEMRNRLLV